MCKLSFPKVGQDRALLNINLGSVLGSDELPVRPLDSTRVSLAEIQKAPPEDNRLAVGEGTYSEGMLLAFAQICVRARGLVVATIAGASIEKAKCTQEMTLRIQVHKEGTRLTVSTYGLPSLTKTSKNVCRSIINQPSYCRGQSQTHRPIFWLDIFLPRKSPPDSIDA